jgi:hypothetical protein
MNGHGIHVGPTSHMRRQDMDHMALALETSGVQTVPSPAAKLHSGTAVYSALDLRSALPSASTHAPAVRDTQRAGNARIRRRNGTFAVRILSGSLGARLVRLAWFQQTCLIIIP